MPGPPRRAAPAGSGATDSGLGAQARAGDALSAPSSHVVLLDGELVPREKAVVSAFDRGVLYGESLFETLKVVGGAPCLWERHRDRLADGCRELGIPLDPPALELGVRRLLERRFVEYGVLRVQVTGGEQPGGGRGITAPTEGRRPRVVASIAGGLPPGDDLYTTGARVVSAAGALRPSPWLKSGNYLASVRAKALAESADAFECVLVDGDPPSLLEGSFSNLLLWDGETLVSPPEGLRLPGVTEAVVLEEATRSGIAVATRPIGLHELVGREAQGDAGEASGGAVEGDVGVALDGEVAEGTAAGRRAPPGLLLTGSLLGVCPCSHLDGTLLGPAAEIAALLRRRLLDREEESRRAWGCGGP